MYNVIVRLEDGVNKIQYALGGGGGGNYLYMI